MTRGAAFALQGIGVPFDSNDPLPSPGTGRAGMSGGSSYPYSQMTGAKGYRRNIRPTKA